MTHIFQVWCIVYSFVLFPFKYVLVAFISETKVSVTWNMKTSNIQKCFRSVFPIFCDDFVIGFYKHNIFSLNDLWHASVSYILFFSSSFLSQHIENAHISQHIIIRSNTDYCCSNVRLDVSPNVPSFFFYPFAFDGKNKTKKPHKSSGVI